MGYISQVSSFNICVIDKLIDGLLGLELKYLYSNSRFILYACYLPPENSNWGRDPESYFAHLLSQIYTFADNSDIIVICGDLNAKLGNLDDNIEAIDSIPKRNILDPTKNLHGECLQEFLISSKMCILNGRINPYFNDFTFISTRGKSVVDYIITGHESLRFCKDFKVLQVSDLIKQYNCASLISSSCKPPDHAVLYCKILMKFSNVANQVTGFDKSPEPKQTKLKRIYNYNLKVPGYINNIFDQNQFTGEINNILFDLYSINSVNDCYQKFLQKVKAQMDNNLEFYDVCLNKENNRPTKSFWDNDLHQAWNKMRLDEKAFKNSKGTTLCCQYRMIFITSRGKFDKMLKSKERAYLALQLQKIENSSNNNPKEFWGHINNLGPNKKATSHIPKSVTIDNKLITDQNIVINKWFVDFSNLYSGPQNDGDYDFRFYNKMIERLRTKELSMALPVYIENEYINNNISYTEIQNIVKQLKNQKAVGMDLLPNEIIKSNSIQIFMFHFFSYCFENGVVPTDWTKAIISPVLKPGKDPHEPLNYRGISLLSCMGKVYSALINSRIVKYCDMQSLICEEQNGFRRGRSCTDHLFVVTSIIRNRLSTNQNTFVALVDFEKAFDWVKRSLLYYRLLENNIDGKIYKAINALYSNNEAYVRLGTQNTDWFAVPNGVRQGDPLSTTLFSIYINSLVDHLKLLGIGIQINDELVCILLYADDIILLAPSEGELQTLILAMESWCHLWQMNVNILKTNIMHFRPKNRKCTDFSFSFRNQKIKIVSEYKYLGFYLHEYLNYEFNASKIADSGCRALGLVINKFKSLKNVAFNSFTKCYNAGVASIIDYSSEIWGFIKAFSCDKVQHRAMRYLLGVHRFCPIPALYGDTGWLRSRNRRMINMIRFWNRLILMDNKRLTKKVYLWDTNSNGPNWSSEIKQILYDFNLENHYDSKIPCNIPELRIKLQNHFENYWLNECNNKPKLRTYVKYKKSFCTEPYVKYYLPRLQMSLLAQLRSGILPLRIETGRFHNIKDTITGQIRRLKVEERICLFCSLQEIEDEIHFICQCPIYNAERTYLFQEVSKKCSDFSDLNNQDKFIYLLTNEYKLLAQFVCTAWSTRRKLLYV